MTAEERVAEANRQTQLCLDSVGKAPLQLEREAFQAFVRRYIFARFLLNSGDTQSEDLRELAQASIHKASLDAGTSARQPDTPDCQNSTAADSKRILLQIRLLKDLGVETSPRLLAKAKTVTELADVIFDNATAIQKP
ncbi:hypothetical protein [Desulfobaculum bizertense]|uniref:Uncharacterized protein n=1 Tax=Desulfobaculum bizertense DSM 18034 TaxID=1121442 RepID=A0A1T4VQ50_9BACT|nr:hypothetical protein [Desulfobaculum bizertense]SKA67113.1 hypothetical protein SAMN02745702_00763 [Desulfobaculum bizertense DSM 18034]